MKNSHSVPQKTKNTIKYDQAISAYSQRELITYIHTQSCTQMLITALFVTVTKSGYNSNTLMNKQNMASPYNGKLFDPEKKNKVLIHVITTLMNPENMLIERSHSQKMTQCIVSFIQNMQNREILETERD